MRIGGGYFSPHQLLLYSRSHIMSVERAHREREKRKCLLKALKPPRAVTFHFRKQGKEENLCVANAEDKRDKTYSCFLGEKSFSFFLIHRSIFLHRGRRSSSSTFKHHMLHALHCFCVLVFAFEERGFLLYIFLSCCVCVPS